MTRPRLDFRIALALLLAAPLAGYAVFWLTDSGTARAEPPAAISSMLLDEPKPLESLGFATGPGTTFGRDELLGDWTLMALGYTHCPDVCPMTLANLADLRAHMAESGGNGALPEVAFVSLDPSRDPPDLVQEYATYFGEGFVGLSGTEAQTDALVAEVGAYYRYGPKDASGFYTVNHSAEIYVIDPLGRLFAKLQPPLDPPQAAQALRAMQTYYAQAGS